jgi:hypothetical protein
LVDHVKMTLVPEGMAMTTNNSIKVNASRFLSVVRKPRPLKRRRVPWCLHGCGSTGSEQAGLDGHTVCHQDPLPAHTSRKFIPRRCVRAATRPARTPAFRLVISVD